jgi:hypothetical protein
MFLRVVTLVLASLVIGLPSASAATCADISNCTFAFNDSDAFGTGLFGTVNLALNTGKITITVDLADDYRLIDTGSHESFTFNDTVGGSLVLDNFSNANYTPGAGNPGTNPPFSIFEHAVVYGGGNNNGVNVLSFVVSRTGGLVFNDVNQLVELSTGGGNRSAYFAADVINGAGVTGAVGANGDPLVSTPEPGSTVLLTSGVGMLLALRYRRRRSNLS